MNTPDLLPFTPRASALWARWRYANAAERLSLARLLPEREALALERLCANWASAGPLHSWWRCTATGLGLRPQVRAVLLSGVELDPRAIPDLVRTVRSERGLPLGTALAFEVGLQAEAGLTRPSLRGSVHRPKGSASRHYRPVDIGTRTLEKVAAEFRARCIDLNEPLPRSQRAAVAEAVGCSPKAVRDGLRALRRREGVEPVQGRRPRKVAA